MSSIVISVAHLITGMLWDKVLDSAADALKDGDSTDEKCRQVIVRELHEIKSKLDGLARKDLLSSISFLSDGICLLNLSHKECKAEERTKGSKKQLEGGRTMAVECCEDSAMYSETSVFHEALMLSQSRLNIAAEKRVLAAKASFEKTYVKATEAFNNEALTTEDRILATKLRVISRILEGVEDPDSSVAICKMYLQQLHDMSAVAKTFSVYFRSGMKSRFHKTKRIENVKIVMMINYILYDYAKKFTEMTVDDVFDWPRIRLAKRTIHPLMLEPDVLMKMEKSGVYTPNQIRFREDEKWIENGAVNSKGEIIVKRCEHFDVIDNKGEIRLSFCLPDQDTKASNFEILALTTNVDDDVYVVSRSKSQELVYNYKVSILDTDGEFKKQFPLESFKGPGEKHHVVCIAVSKEKEIFLTKQDEAMVCVFDNMGQLKRSFVFEAWHLVKCLSVSDENEVIAAELVGKAVGVYSAERGEWKRDIEIPGLHKVCSVAYHHVSKRILVLTEVMPACFNVYQLQSYSIENGELEQALALPGRRDEGYKIISHPRGPVVIVHKTGAIYI